MRLQKPLMLAYILFLVICSIYYVLCKPFGLEFDTWQKIIIAATIASYFFSINSINKSILKQTTENKEFLLEEFVLLNKIHKKIKKDYVDKGEEKSILISFDEMIAENERLSQKAEKLINRYSKLSFIFDVLGYLTFFMIMGIDGLSNIFVDALELFTLLAFIVIIFVEYIESTLFVRYKNAHKSMVKNREDLLNHLNE